MSNGQPDRAALLKTRALIVAAIVTNVTGNTLLSRGLHHSSRLSGSFLHYVYAVASPWALAGIVVLACWMIANLSLLSRADLSYVLPVTGSVSYVLIALTGHFFLGESVSVAHWVGVAIISVGVFLVFETSPLTVAVHEPPEDEI